MNKWLYRYSTLVMAATLLLILAGGLVTSHEAGLAVPDWPLSYGQLFPPMVGNIFWEHGHRMIAGSVGILTLILTLWIHRVEKRKVVRILAWTALGSVIAQAVLGGLTVIFLLPPAVSIAHACLAQTFFCLVIAVNFYLGPLANLAISENEKIAPDNFKKARRLLIFTFALIYSQLIVGAMVRHTGHGVVFHIVIAFLILIHALLVVLKISRLYPEGHFLAYLSRFFGLLVMVQIFLGMGSFIFTRMLERGYTPSVAEVFFTVAHQTTGAVILGSCLLMAIRVHHGLRKTVST